MLNGRASVGDEAAPEDVWQPPTPSEDEGSGCDELSCSGISVGAVAERIATIFCSGTKQLWVLGLDDCDQDDVSGELPVVLLSDYLLTMQALLLF